MKQQHVLALACACSLTVAVLAGEPKSATRPPADARQQVLDLDNEWAAAETKHDAAALDRILDDKFLVTFGSKKPYDKAAFVKAITQGEVDPTESQSLTDASVIVDGDTAIVIGTDTLHGTKNGAAYTEVARYTVTYVYRHGQWRALAEHLVFVPQASR
jgi:ketosteroid isomerase-like protein